MYASSPYCAHESLKGHLQYLELPYHLVSGEGLIETYLPRSIGDTQYARYRIKNLPSYAFRGGALGQILSFALGYMEGRPVEIRRAEPTGPSLGELPHAADADIAVPGVTTSVACLFDREGFWIARTKGELAILYSYCQHIRELSPEERHRNFVGCASQPIEIEWAGYLHNASLVAVAHRGLHSIAEFVSYGTSTGHSSVAPEPLRSRLTFWGQLPRFAAADPSEAARLIGWLLVRIAGISEARVYRVDMLKGPGGAHSNCLAATLSIGDQAWETAKRRLHGRLMFDWSGVWLVSDGAGQSSLEKYTETYRERHNKHSLLPHNTLVCEDKHN